MYKKEHKKEIGTYTVCKIMPINCKKICILFSRTIPLRPDDYQRFKPEYWLQNQNPPNPVAFTDLSVIQSELELRRRREIHRQNSHRMHADGQENNFNSLPWEEIIPRRISGK